MSLAVKDQPAEAAPDTADPAGAPAVRPAEATALILGALLLASMVIGTRWGVFTPDTRPDLYQDPAAFVRATVSAWVGGASGLGQGNFNAGAAPVGMVVWLIRTLGAPAWLAVRIWRLVVLLLAAWGIRRYLNTLMGDRLSAQARLLATVFWVVNPYVIVAGSTTPILLPYALLPWTMLAFVRATRQPRSWQWPALFALGFFAQTGLNAGVVPFFQLLALPAHLVFARYIEGTGWRPLGRVLVRCGALSAAVSLYWLLPSLLASGTGAGIAGATENPADVARTSSYAETARLLGNWPLYGRAGDRLFLGDYTIYLTSPVVVLATFAIVALVGVALWRTRERERLLVVGLLMTALPVMVGLFPPADAPPAGRLLAAVFDRVPASLAFRTTNKVGAVVVLAVTIALAFGWRAWQQRSVAAGRLGRMAAVGMVAALLAAVSAPLWTGGLYPLGYTVPDSWLDATKDLDGRDTDGRVLVVPGGTGGNYRWGMRSPDDLFPSLLDRPVVVRNTVVGRGDAAGNYLSAFDLALAQGALPEDALSTTARYLGAPQVLVRNDLLTEEIGGPAPWLVVAQADADPGLRLVESYGPVGEDTVPGGGGPATEDERAEDPADARLRPLLVYDVINPHEPVRANPALLQVLTVGDGVAVVTMAAAGIVDGDQPIRFVADLDDEEFAEAVALGGRVVLTDTNRRRAWDINRVANATSPTLTVDEDLDGGDGATTTRWPDDAEDQTVAVLPDGITIGADRPGFGLQPYGRPANAFDGDPGTAWLTGGFGTAPGSSIWIEFDEPRSVETITITAFESEPSSVEAIRVKVGDKQVTEAIPPGDDELLVNIEPTTADRIEVTVLAQSPGDNPVGLAEIDIDGTVVRGVARVPDTLTRRAEAADAATRERLAMMAFDLVFRRASGALGDLGDDEEAQLDRLFTIPDDREFSFAAELAVTGADSDAVEAARAGDRPCLPVALLDDEPVLAKIVSTDAELNVGRLLLEGCDPISIEAGKHEFLTVFGWRLNTVQFASAAEAAMDPHLTGATIHLLDDDSADVQVTGRTATRIEMMVGPSGLEAGGLKTDGDRYLRLGEAFDPRWRLSVDGVDAGPPILIDGYSTGWLIDVDSHTMVAEFGPQGAVKASFVVSAVALVGVTGLALAPLGRRGRGRRRRGQAHTEGPPA